MRNGKKSYNFSDKKHSKDGKLATMIGVVAWILFLFMAVQSILSKGHVGEYVGMLGLVVVVMTFVGTVIAVLSFKEEDILPFYPRVGVGCNSILFCILVALLVCGILF